MAAKDNTRIWGAIALVAGVVVGLSYGLDWLGLSVDGIVRDDVVVNDVTIAGSELSIGFILLVLAVLVAVCALVALLRFTASKALGWLVAIGGLGAAGYALYVYLARDDAFTQTVVDAIASDDVPSEDVERAIDLALRGGVEVLPQLGLFVAAIGGLVALLMGVLMTRQVAGHTTTTAAQPEPMTKSQQANRIEPPSDKPDVYKPDV